MSWLHAIGESPDYNLGNVKSRHSTNIAATFWTNTTPVSFARESYQRINISIHPIVPQSLLYLHPGHYELKNEETPNVVLIRSTCEPLILTFKIPRFFLQKVYDVAGGGRGKKGSALFFLFFSFLWRGL